MTFLFLFLSLCFAEFSFKIPAVLKLNTMKGMQLGLSLVHHYELLLKLYGVPIHSTNRGSFNIQCEEGSPIPQKSYTPKGRGGLFTASIKVLSTCRQRGNVKCCLRHAPLLNTKADIRTPIGTGFRVFLSFKLSG